jgi:RND family efflux transporter MFP subunit
MAVALILCALTALYWIIKSQSLQNEEDEIQTDVTVETATVQKQTLRGYLYLYGTVTADPGSGSTPAASMQITAPSDGLLERVHCREGQVIQKGDVLFSMDSRLASADASFAENNFNRQKALYGKGTIAEKTFLEAKRQFELSQTGLALCEVTAPFSGTITGIKCRAGETVQTGQPLCALTDFNRLVIVTKVPVREADLLVAGHPVYVYKSAGENGNALVQGTVCYISPDADPDTATVTVHCALPPGGGLRAGQFVHIRIATAVKENCLTVPVESIYTDYDGKSTLSVVEGDIARKVIVSTGLIENGQIEIQGAGLTENMTVVTRGSYALPETTRITVNNPAQ